MGHRRRSPSTPRTDAPSASAPRAHVSPGGTPAAGDEADRRELAAVADDVAATWRLALGPPFPGGTASWVTPARDEAGRDLVLKIARTHDEARDEAAGLLAWQGRGAVTVHRTVVDGATTVLLLDRCRPGTPLAAAASAEEADEVIAALVRTLWIVPPPGSPFRPLAEMCDQWAGSAAARLGHDAHGLPAEMVEAGLDLFRRLPRDPVEPVLLATDLHHLNVLAVDEATTGPSRGPCGWRLIDPKPYVGDPHYDLLQQALNAPDRLAADPIGLIDRMAHLTGLDRDRARTWLFARCVQEAGAWDGLAEAAITLARVVL
ncbi:aminoglycoside phosphotransferase family protein [Brachybacterium huguangmaarense]|uniref:Aminoglycoside phosphotransferase family protein n=1 Tax=Brachybacterium huguangmaarense TaxID=1652028 RepID=A0ABY6G2U9_9MICO|nr:aminoglycoside phosphotransferase family protein [Brachybacterium huguangmaarense]UYG17541.1 aminoglycoside phosphotransferase family protein [Brachybacterium huguangmaarense]